MKLNEVIISPILTEKSTSLSRKGVYLFEVNGDANKFQIKAVLEKIYPVKVEAINIGWRKGKIRRVGRKMKIKKLASKKIAFVKLKEGKIDVFPQI
ncbi:MAG: 50S ribosomal protein L23 [Patescibacteria group bacterium]|nr:50S ribosomal protein L23 [Patescibacteria group bacterium]